jgi:hypothetical protein
MAIEVIAAVLGLLLAQTLWAERAYTGMLANESSGSGEWSIYVDFSTFRKTENGRRAWFLWNLVLSQPPFLSVKPVPSFGYQSEKILYEFDRSNDSIKTLQRIAYQRPWGRGSNDSFL